MTFGLAKSINKIEKPNFALDFGTFYSCLKGGAGLSLG